MTTKLFNHVECGIVQDGQPIKMTFNIERVNPAHDGIHTLEAFDCPDHEVLAAVESGATHEGATVFQFCDTQGLIDGLREVEMLESITTEVFEAIEAWYRLTEKPETAQPTVVMYRKLNEVIDGMLAKLDWSFDNDFRWSVIFEWVSAYTQMVQEEMRNHALAEALTAALFGAGEPGADDPLMAMLFGGNDHNTLLN